MQAKEKSRDGIYFLNNFEIAFPWCLKKDFLIYFVKGEQKLIKMPFFVLLLFLMVAILNAIKTTHLMSYKRNFHGRNKLRGFIIRDLLGRKKDVHKPCMLSSERVMTSGKLTNCGNKIQSQSTSTSFLGNKRILFTHFVTQLTDYWRKRTWTSANVRNHQSTWRLSLLAYVMWLLSLYIPKISIRTYELYSLHRLLHWLYEYLMKKLLSYDKTKIEN